MQPRRLTPTFLEKVWGSTHLAPWFPNTNRKIGEVWFHTDEIPLLVKFLFTTEKLSVQVHPGDDYAHANHDCFGKTEMWHILRADPGASIAAGFRSPITAERLKAASLSGEIENLLEWFDASPGDTFFIPAGTVHAIGGGLALCEIQQHSDVTYRLYDYGRPRELHLDHGVTVSDLHPYPARSKPSGEVLASCGYFTTSRIKVDGEREIHTDHGAILVAIEGAAELDGERTVAGEAWHIPTGATATLRGNITVLLAQS